MSFLLPPAQPQEPRRSSLSLSTTLSSHAATSTIGYIGPGISKLRGRYKSLMSGPAGQTSVIREGGCASCLYISNHQFPKGNFTYSRGCKGSRVKHGI